MSDHDECTESYQECMRQRQERVQQAIEANPKATTREIADIAGVSPMAVSRNKSVNNVKAVTGVTNYRSVKLSELYDPDILYGDHKTVRTIELALERCTKPELAYILDRLFPFFNEVLKRRTYNERTKKEHASIYSATGTADAGKAADE